MLSNHADQFMLTPMRHTVVTQNGMNAPQMPAPRPSGGFLPGLGEGSFLPGIGAEFLPGMGEYRMAPAYSGTGMLDFSNPKTLLLWGALAVGGWMLLRGKGKRGASSGPGKAQYK
jgi:hypothetical protein